nr:immunoglobulin heavy chain junction region [Mus musculus]
CAREGYYYGSPWYFDVW